jgi:hypothetical protein
MKHMTQPRPEPVKIEQNKPKSVVEVMRDTPTAMGVLPQRLT